MSLGADWVELSRACTDRFAALVVEAELEAQLDAPVRACPGWALHDLVVHLGGVHQWAAHAVTEGHPSFRPAPVERGRAGLAAWYQHHASRLVEVLGETPPDAPAWTLDDQDRTAGFWRRRQVHETAMHTWDAEEALGAARPIDASLAWDGVLEVRDVMYPRQVRLGRVEPLAPAVRLVATDVSGDLTIGDGEPVLVRDRAEVLLRLLWGRADPAELADPAASRLLPTGVTP